MTATSLRVRIVFTDPLLATTPTATITPAAVARADAIGSSAATHHEHPA